MKRSNKIHPMDLFTQAANEHFEKHIRTQSKRALQTLDELIDWDRLVDPLEAAIQRASKSTSAAGRPRHDLRVIVKCFLLQRIFDLSDPRLEEEIADRLSFRLFLGLTSSDSIPDETTLVRYRKLFASLKLDTLLFTEYNHQLQERGLIVGKGTAIDATIKQAQAHSNSNRDTDARYAKKKGSVTFGYKGHVGMDTDTEVIHSAVFTPGNEADTNVFEPLVRGTETIVYADKAYPSEERAQWLRRHGMQNGILRRASRAHPLSAWKQRRNKQLSKTRAAVERPFAFMKHVLHYTRCRYFDIGRNRFQFFLTLIVYNMRRDLSLSVGVR